MFMTTFINVGPLTIKFTNGMSLRRLNKPSTYIPTVFLCTIPERCKQHNTHVTWELHSSGLLCSKQR